MALSFLWCVVNLLAMSNRKKESYVVSSCVCLLTYVVFPLSLVNVSGWGTYTHTQIHAHAHTYAHTYTHIRTHGVQRPLRMLPFLPVQSSCMSCRWECSPSSRRLKQRRKTAPIKILRPPLVCMQWCLFSLSLSLSLSLSFSLSLSRSGGFVCIPLARTRECDWSGREEESDTVFTHCHLFLLAAVPPPRLLAVTGDHNFLFHYLSDFVLEKCLVGFNDEIIDIQCLPDGRRAAVTIS